ncbi:MAG TPA: hypothetical protein VMW35_19785, partial [Myxococcota bacterium]|nr:hypothetical protein [Myxococcota bacterium]
MADLDLLRTHKADVFKIVVKAGFDAGLFEWIRVPSTYKTGDTVEALCFRGTSYRFVFDTGGAGQWRTFYSPGSDKRFEGRQYPNWASALNGVFDWLHTLLAEISTPDPWAELAGQVDALLGFHGGSSENSPFAPHERAQILASLRAMRIEVLALS